MAVLRLCLWTVLVIVGLGGALFLLLRLHAYTRDSSIVRHVDQRFIEMGGLKRPT